MKNILFSGQMFQAADFFNDPVRLSTSVYGVIISKIRLIEG